MCQLLGSKFKLENKVVILMTNFTVKHRNKMFLKASKPLTAPMVYTTHISITPDSRTVEESCICQYLPGAFN